MKDLKEQKASTMKKHSGMKHETSDGDTQLAVLASVVENPAISVRQVDSTLDYLKSLVHKVAKRIKFHPYRSICCQQLSQQDHRSRMQL